MQEEVIGIFPVPVMRVRQALDQALVAALVGHFTAQADRENSSSDHLVHTAMLRPSDSPLLVEAAALISPRLADFGALLFGEPLGWSLKEMWVNFMAHGGRQAMHNHANSFVSGVVYLTPTDAASSTVFMKSPGGHEFAFKNDNPRVSPNAFNGDQWISPPAEAGDMVLFPSYLMHAVPPNQGARRISMAFNAIPTQLDSWGYRIGFTG